jgi:hypothetical protein
MTIESSGLLDEIDRNLLSALQEDARLSYAELGRRVGLSPAATAERLRRLEEAGIITGYRAKLIVSARSAGAGNRAHELRRSEIPPVSEGGGDDGARHGMPSRGGSDAFI